MTDIDPIAFCTLAVSKNQAQHGLTGVYRDTDRLVATDGHRLHSYLMHTIDKPHFLNGLDAQFPDYKGVYPTKAISVSLEIYANSDTLARLKALCALVSVDDKRMPCADLYADHDGIRWVYNWQTVSARIPMVGAVTGDPMIVRLNLKYWIDVFSIAVKAGTANKPTVLHVNYYGEGMPVLIKVNDTRAEALIMPVRRD